jgi:hypothetical protein
VPGSCSPVGMSELPQGNGHVGHPDGMFNQRNIQSPTSVKRDEVVKRSELLIDGFDGWKIDHKNSSREFPGLPYYLLHSISHLLMTAISLECGYPGSSLRERIYTEQGEYAILIYTGSSDSEGTLGGLVLAGRPSPWIC